MTEPGARSIVEHEQVLADALARLHAEGRYRVFADLERQGLIKRRGREILFTDWNELRRIAGFQPGYLQ